MPLAARALTRSSQGATTYGSLVRQAASATFLAAAVADNVAWCDAVCRSLGRPTSRTPARWSVADPPRWYPHRITLRPDVTSSEAVAGLPDDTDCCVKDAYSDLDLARYGFAPVTDASWVHRSPSVAATAEDGWSLVQTADELAEWAAAAGLDDVVTPPLLSIPGVRLVSVRQGGRVVAGAALSCTADVVGVSNVFHVDAPAPDPIWRMVVGAANQLFPERDLIGYEQGAELTAAQCAGFAPIGALRIWHRPAGGS